MPARILKEGMYVSRIFTPETKFGVTLRSTNADPFENIYLYVSPDKVNWIRGHNVPFDSDTKVTDRFGVPDGFHCQLQGAVDMNVEAHVGYLSDIGAHQYAIQNVIEDGEV